jgi:hypothetical protein
MSAYKIGPQREFTLATVYQNSKLNASRAANIGQRIERSAGGAPGGEHIVYQNNYTIANISRNNRAAYLSSEPPGARVITIQRNIKLSHWHLMTIVVDQGGSNASGQGHSLTVNAHQDNIMRTFVALHYFLRHPRHGPVYVVGIEDLLLRLLHKVCARLFIHTSARYRVLIRIEQYSLLYGK